MNPCRAAALLTMLFALSALPVLTGCQSGPVPAADFVAQADRLHDSALRSAVAPDRDLTDYFNAIGRRIIQGASDASGGKFRDPVFANMQFHLVGSDIPNAFTTGGSHIYVYNGLFQLCRTEEELAAVMAHEFAHAVDLDVQRTGMRPAPGDTTDRIAYLYVGNPFGANLEREADARAFEFYARGGWDPAKYADFFRRLQGVPGLSGGGGRGAAAVPGLPLPARASAAADLQGSLPAASRDWRKAAVADPQTFLELRARANQVAGGERMTPQGPQNRAWLYLRAFPNCVLPNDLPAQRAAQEQLRRDITPVAPPTPIEPS